MSQQKTKKKKGTVWKVLLVILLLLAAAGAALWYAAASSLYGRITYEETAAADGETGQEQDALRQDGVTNILLIGNDSRENGEDGRSDAMILLSISTKTKTIQMISLLRDTYVEIPGHDGNRLNAAYAFGGPKLLMETIEENFQIPVSHYVLVNFEAFANLVDAVGGVDLELTSEEVEYVNGYLVEYNQLTGRPEGTDYLLYCFSIR